VFGANCIHYRSDFCFEFKYSSGPPVIPSFLFQLVSRLSHPEAHASASLSLSLYPAPPATVSHVVVAYTVRCWPITPAPTPCHLEPCVWAFKFFSPAALASMRSTEGSPHPWSCRSLARRPPPHHCCVEQSHRPVLPPLGRAGADAATESCLPAFAHRTEPLLPPHPRRLLRAGPRAFRRRSRQAHHRLAASLPRRSSAQAEAGMPPRPP
jgi:hypothetical protein